MSNCGFQWTSQPGDTQYYICSKSGGHNSRHYDFCWNEEHPATSKWRGPPFSPAGPHAESRLGDWLASLTSEQRKEVAVARGLFAYFPDALALVARHSVRSNEKHNPGQPLHWSREKSNDHEDCIARHSISVAVDVNSMDGDAPHIICRAWRALAALQLWVENQRRQGKPV